MSNLVVGLFIAALSITLFGVGMDTERERWESDCKSLNVHRAGTNLYACRHTGDTLHS